MAYNTQLQTKTIRGLVNSGADLMTNMYDVSIFFPTSEGVPNTEATDDLGYPITIRQDGFDVPDVAIDEYEIHYHGVHIYRPKTMQLFDRKFDLTFREDAAFNLRKRFTAWHAAVVDPVNGGVSNAAQFFGRVEVGTISGAYFAPTVANDLEIPGSGHLLNQGNEYNGLAGWKFYNVWVQSVTGLKFVTDSADPHKFTVSFRFMDFDAPQYAENPLDVDLATDWNATTSIQALGLAEVQGQ